MARPHRHLIACLLPLLLSAPLVHAQTAQKPKAVVELFTSQGCSSCPPADALMVELSQDPDVVALTLPVTYWDYLGWKDTLGQDAFSKRQKLYAKARGDNQIYTPQAVINGTSHMIGSEKSEIRKRIADITTDPLDAAITLTEDGGTLRIALAPLPGAPETSGSVWVLPTSRAVTVPITRGENQGKTVSYANVVRALMRVGSWDGKAGEIRVPIAATQAPDADGYVVIVQAEKPGRFGYTYPGEILAAARSGR